MNKMTVQRTWGPLFALGGAFALSVSAFGAACQTVQGPARTSASMGPSGLAVTEEWRHNVFGHRLGVGGLYIADLDGDGDREIVAATGEDSFWEVVERAPDGSYIQTWASDQFSQRITSLRVAQVDADPALEIVVGSASDVFVYDGATYRLERSWTSAAGEVFALNVADVDGDGALEAVFCDKFWTDALYIYDLTTGVQEYAGAGYGCDDVAIGNVDGDSGLEIVVASGVSTGEDGTGYVLNGATRAVEWTNSAGFGHIVRLADVDGDGRQEIIGVRDWVDVVVFDADLQSQAASRPLFDNVNALEVVDLEGDGPLEIVYGDAQHGRVHILNSQSLALKWETVNSQNRVNAIAAGDLDGDLARELVWASEGFSRLFVVDSMTRAVEWESVDFRGPFRALSYGDVDADGQPEFLYGSFESDEERGLGIWFVRDARTKALEYQSPRPSENTYNVLTRIANANIDADPQQEIFVSSTREIGGSGSIVCYDGLTHAEQWRTSSGSSDIYALQIANVDSTPGLEIVTAARISTGLQVMVFDAATGALKWQTPVPSPVSIMAPAFSGQPVLLMRVGNVDADANPEIVVARWGGYLYIVDTVTHAVSDLGYQNVMALDLADRDGNGIQEIVVGTGEGQLGVVSPTGSVAEVIGTYPFSFLLSLKVLDVTGDGIADYILSVDDQILIRDGASGAELWNSGLSPWPLLQIGSGDSMLVADIDGDGKLEIMVSLGEIGLRIYEIPLPIDLALSVADSPDPALVANNVTYVWTIANPSSRPASNVTLTVALPAGATFVSSTPAAPTCTVSAGSLTCILSVLASTSTTNVAMVVTPTGPGQLSTSGTLTAGQPDPAPANNLASATTIVTSTVQADLALAMDDGRVLVGTGQSLTYGLSVVNQGPWPVTSVVLTDTLPATLLGPSYLPSAGSYNPGTGAWTGLSLGAGQSASLALTATVAPAAAGTIVNSALVSPPAGVDDVVPGNNAASDTDVVAAERSELAHGTSLVGHVDAQGDRYFAISQKPWSSYEIVVDEVSGDLGDVGTPLLLQRLAPDMSVAAESVATGVAFSRSLRWQSALSTVIANEAIRVRSTGCTSACDAADVFRVRAYDTTYVLARFNNSGGQVSVVLIQNAGHASAGGLIHFWSPSGVHLTSVPFAGLAPGSVLALNTSTLSGVAGLAGSITVTNDAPYGALVGKVVAVDPTTGLAFDTPMRPRPH